MHKIAIFHSALDGGGAERVILNLARGFADKGFHVDFILTRAEGPYLSQIPSNVNLVNFNQKKLLWSLLPLVQYLRKEQPAIILSALEDNSLVVLWACRLARVTTKSVVTVHHNLSLEAEHTTELRRKLTPRLVRYFYPWADKVVSVSQGVADDLVRIGISQKKVNVIYNPIFTQDLVEKQKESANHPWLTPDHPPVILAVGRLTEQKNFASLLRAFAQVRRQQPVKLIFLGEGEERDTLESLAQNLSIDNDVDFVGFVSNPYAYMADANVLVLSSVWEGFGNVLIEAMAAGTPVISTNCKSGPAEILADGKYGKLIPVGDDLSLAKAISKTLSEPIRSEFLKSRAMEFSLESSIDKYLKLLFVD